MMTSFFADYEQFKELFGTPSNRRNSVVLDFIKYMYSNRHHDRAHNELFCMIRGKRINLNDIMELVVELTHKVSYQHQNSRCWGDDDIHKSDYTVNIVSLPTMYHETIRTDDYHGICEDNSIDSIRFERHLTKAQRERTEDGLDHPKIVKKKAGRLLRELITSWLPELPESVINYACEAFANKWKANRISEGTRYVLHIDEDFDSIYDNGFRPCRVTGSCMAGENQSHFYDSYVIAHAAYLTDSEDNDAIVARCILFDEVFDEDGNKYRYAERQYSADGNLALKQLLINKLIEGKHIDLFKEVGASYGDVNRIYRVSDNALLSTRKFYIVNTIQPGDTLSFQDTFVWLKDGKAWNYEINGYDYELNTTSSELEGCWDDYHEYYCARTIIVNVWNERRCCYNEMSCDEDNLNDFTQDCDDNKWYDDVVECTNGRYYRRDSENVHYSIRDDCYYYNYDCRYSDYHDDYISDDEAVWSDYHNTYIHEDDAIEINGDWYAKDADCIIKTSADNVVIDGDTAYIANI